VASWPTHHGAVEIRKLGMARDASVLRRRRVAGAAKPRRGLPVELGAPGGKVSFFLARFGVSARVRVRFSTGWSGAFTPKGLTRFLSDLPCNFIDLKSNHLLLIASHF
jgi:hypothetical protein